MKLGRILTTGVLATIALCVSPVVQQGFAGTVNLSTGQDAGGTIQASGNLADANWTVDPGSCSTPPCGTAVTANTVFPNNADWYGGWLANDTNSDWIARDPNVSNNGPANYAFYFDFNLADITGASISGSWAIDDSGLLILNGTTIATLGSGAWGGLTSFSDSTAADFVTGTNTLEIEITSSDQFLEAVRLTGTVTGDLGGGTAPAPEPSSWVLLAGGLGFAAFLYSRKKATA